MANNVWKPLYEYKESFVSLVLYYISLFLSFLFLLLGAMIIGADNYFGVIPIVIGGSWGCTMVFINYTLSPNRVKKKLQKHGIEYLCETKGLLLVKTASQKMGLFTRTGDVIINPEYRNIVFKYDYYLLENIVGLWGVYNTELSKHIIDCEYSNVKVENNKNITATKNGIRFTFSPYGSIVHQTNAATDDLINNIMGKM